MRRIFPYLVCMILPACYRKGAVEHATQWRRVDRCSFSLRIPAACELTNRELPEGHNPSDCHYRGTIDGQEAFSIHSSPANLFDSQNVDSLYRWAIDYSKFTVVHTDRKGNWFVVSGVSPETGNSIYWKRVVGTKFITDLYFDYPKAEAEHVEPFMEGMAVSLVSD